MMRFAAAAVLLPAAVLGQGPVELCKTGDDTCSVDPAAMSIPSQSIKVFKVDIASPEGDGPDGPGDCPATCDDDGVVYCTGTCPAAPPEIQECLCVDGWRMGFDIADRLADGSLSDGRRGDMSQLAFGISRTAPEDVDIEGGSAYDAATATFTDTAGGLFDLFEHGEWKVTPKEFNAAHEINVGRKGHKEVDSNMVELCRTFWNDNEASGTKADAECNCADCNQACGLKGSRRSTPCDDFACAGSFPNGLAVASTRCADAVMGGSVGHCEDPTDMCDDKFQMQPNCTAYAMASGLPDEAQNIGYCCGMKPQSFIDAAGVDRLYFPTAVGGGPGGDVWSDPYCDLDRSSPSYGYETQLALPQRLEYADCSAAQMTAQGTVFYLYVVNSRADSSISLAAANITWSKSTLSPSQVWDCAVPEYSGAAQAAPAAMLAAAAALLAALW
jgi:hypothetical protein